jgi:Common central domain of tyrosinase
MLALLIQLTLTVSVFAQCTNPTVRPGWRTLPDAQRKSFLSAVKALKNRPAGSQGNMANWNYDQFVQCHWDNVAVAHGIPAFLPWHRKFVDGFDKALKSIDASVNLPYWVSNCRASGKCNEVANCKCHLLLQIISCIIDSNI